jgi:hypothetical protein
VKHLKTIALALGSAVLAGGVVLGVLLGVRELTGDEDPAGGPQPEVVSTLSTLPSDVVPTLAEVEAAFVESIACFAAAGVTVTEADGDEARYDFEEMDLRYEYGSSGISADEFAAIEEECRNPFLAVEHAYATRGED